MSKIKENDSRKHLLDLHEIFVQEFYIYKLPRCPCLENNGLFRSICSSLGVMQSINFVKFNFWGGKK